MTEKFAEVIEIYGERILQVKDITLLPRSYVYG